MSAVNFVLSAFQSEFQLSTAAAIPDLSLSISGAATITLTADVPQAVLQSAFYFQTDDPITLDASAVHFFSDKAVWTSSQGDLNPKNGTVTTGQYVQSDNVSKDFIRDLADQLFGTYLGADLFTNEDAVVVDINAQCDVVAQNIATILSSIDVNYTTGTKLAGLISDASYGWYLDDNTSTSNIGRELFNQLMNTAPSRFVHVETDYKYGANPGFYKMPIKQGDSISFNLTINAAPDQHTIVNTGVVGPLNARVYIVTLFVGA